MLRLLTSLVFFLILFFPTIASATPRFSINQKTITINDVTPFGSVAFYRVARFPQGYESRVVRNVEILTDSDGDRAITVTLPESPPLKSLWVAVDMTTGQVGIGAPMEFTFQELAADRLHFQRDLSGAAAEFMTERPSADVLLVRKLTGAWFLHVADGAPDDADQSVNGELRAAAGSMTRVGASPAAPALMLPNDVVILVDVTRMEYTITTLTR